MMQHVADAFTAAAVLAGLWAAWLWWQSGHFSMDPKWNAAPSKPNAETIEGVIENLEAIRDPRWHKAFNEAVDLSSSRNSHAAAWTAASVAFQAVATVVGRLAVP